MEYKNLEKAIISKINGEEEDTSLVINKGKDGSQFGEEERNNSKPSFPNSNDLAIIKQETVAINSNNTTDPSISETNTNHSSPSILIKNDQQEDKVKSAYKAKMGEVREENERLKLLLARIVTDYQSLQSQFFDILRQQETKATPSGSKSSEDNHMIRPKNEEEPHRDDQLVYLSLGRTSSTIVDEPKIKNETIKKTSSGSNCKDQDNEGFDDGELALALGSVSETTKNSSSHDNISDKADQKKDDQEVEPTEMWQPSKALKTARLSGHDHHDDEVSQTLPLKKARVSVRARCEGPTMNDGCQWRKYGQKISKGNPCPRAYYRCTVSPSCPVRKQVQRCVEDMSILITTYEGTHNHPLPISATAMASTTSAAASMLQSRSTTSSSSSSQPTSLLLPSSISGPISASETSCNAILPPGLNFTTTTTGTSTNLFQNSLRPSSSPQQFYFPNTSISTSNSHPTITLDLTLPNPNPNHQVYSSHIFGRGLSSNASSAPRYPSTSLSFSSSSLDPSNNYYNSYFNHRNNYPVGSNGNYNKHALVQEITSSNFYQSYLNNANNNNQTTTTTTTTSGSSSITNQQSLTETIAAATKAITSNPKFQSALAAALTSFVGNGTGSGV